MIILKVYKNKGVIMSNRKETIYWIEKTKLPAGYTIKVQRAYDYYRVVIFDPKGDEYKVTICRTLAELRVVGDILYNLSFVW